MAYETWHDVRWDQFGDTHAASTGTTCPGHRRKSTKENKKFQTILIKQRGLFFEKMYDVMYTPL